MLIFYVPFSPLHEKVFSSSIRGTHKGEKDLALVAQKKIILSQISHTLQNRFLIIKMEEAKRI